MKIPIPGSTLIALVAATSIMSAQESPPDVDPFDGNSALPKIIRVQVEFIEVAHTALTKLMKAPRTTANDTDLRVACEKLIEKNEATVFETSIINALPGKSTTVESISEFIYATEYEPSELPNTQNIKAKEVKGGTFDVERLMTPPTPISFDTKKVGTTLEVEAQLGASAKIIDLQLSPTLVYFTGWETWSEWNIKEATSEMKMPTFYNLRASIGISLLDGQAQMVAVQSPKDEEGNTDQTRKIMIFVRADILTLGK